MDKGRELCGASINVPHTIILGMFEGEKREYRRVKSRGFTRPSPSLLTFILQCNLCLQLPQWTLIQFKSNTNQLKPICLGENVDIMWVSCGYHVSIKDMKGKVKWVFHITKRSQKRCWAKIYSSSFCSRKRVDRKKKFLVCPNCQQHSSHFRKISDCSEFIAQGAMTKSRYQINSIHGVSGGTVNILGGGSMNYSG